MKTLTPNISQLRMLSSLRGQLWMIRPDMVADFALAALEAKEDKPEQKGEDWREDYYPMRKAAYVDANGIGHVEIKGALMEAIARIYEKLGLATKYETIISETNALVDSGAKAILYHVNSPGGTVAGNVEAASFIQNLAVPTASFCQGLSCSAAYKLSASTNFIIATPSASVGNIGTILSWADCSEFWKEMGIEFKALTSEGADLKSTFHLEPNETQLAFLQESIDAAGKQFRDSVKANRPQVDDEVFRAGWYEGERAESLGLIDGIGDAEDAAEALKQLTI